MKAPIVHTFDMKRIDSLIKESDKELQQYIRALKDASDGWEQLTKDAVSKLRQQSEQSSKHVICASDPCRYCVHDGKREFCNPCYEHGSFQGRRLTSTE